MAHLLDHPVVAERYFFPRRAAIADPFTVQVPGAELACYRAAPHAHAATVLPFHGNGEVVSDWVDDVAPALVDAGLNLVLAEYRGYGGSSGAPALATMLDDALAVARATGVDPSRLLVYGRSVGSIYALHVAAQLQTGALVLESGISDVLARLLIRLEPAELGTTAGELRRAATEACDHQAKLAEYRGRVLVLHTRGDDLVPPDNARELAAWAGPEAQLHLYDRGDHNSIWAYNGADILARVTDLASQL